MVDSASDASLQSDGDCELEVRSDVGSDADSNGPPGLILSGSSSQGDHESMMMKVLSLRCSRITRMCQTVIMLRRMVTS